MVFRGAWQEASFVNKENDPRPEAPMPTTATTLKDELIEMLRRLPDNLSLEELDYHFFLFKKLKLSQQAHENGEVYSHEEVRERLKKWLTE